MSKLPITAATALLGALLALGQARAQEYESFEEFREAVEEEAVLERGDYRQRLETFRNSNPEQQQMLLEEARAQITEAEARSEDLETSFEDNELLVQNVRSDLREELGPLNEMFGVLQQVSGQSANQFRTSLTNIEFPERIDFLSSFSDRLGVSDRLPETSEIERLWFELMREATELGKVKSLPNQRYVTADGREVSAKVVRIGDFNVVADGRYLQHSPASNSIAELQRQPAGRFVEGASALVNAEPGDGLVRFGVDMTRGTVINNLADTATWRDQVRYGGTPGYVILALGLIGILLSIERFIALGIASRKVKAQLKRGTPSDDNALGRVLRVHEENRNVDTETLELKLSEAILKETPPLQRGILYIKIISVVAPLLGLLGTVIGMIATFESITLFGTGDPSIMAGGISQALVTTQFGLMVAIPTVLLHTIVNGQYRRIVQVLQENSAGIVAEHAKQSRAAT